MTVTLPEGLTAGTYTIDPSHSEVGFVARHAMVTKVRGRFTDVEGTLTFAEGAPVPASAEAKIAVASVTTGAEDRDAHLKSGDFFDVERFPVVRFASQRISRLGVDRFRVEGTLDLRGILKPMTLEVTYHGVAKDPWGNERAGFATEAVINRKEFGMIWNAALDNGGLILGDDVTLAIDLETVRKS